MSPISSPLLATVLLLLSIFLQRTSAACHVDDRSALLSFKSGITQDPSGLLTTWKPTTDCRSWYGVSFGQNNRVSSLSIYGQVDDPKGYLSGTISNSLSKLRYLNSIYLINLRNITGPFPVFLSAIPDMTFIYIENSKLSGRIPSDIGIRFPKLSAFSLLENQFTGSIPSSVSQLTDLGQLVLGGNKLTGSIPDGIRRLTNLGYLNLEKNQLSGKLPDVFDSFKYLRILRLSHNKLSGEIPPSILKLAPVLQYLELGNNLLTGKIPDYIGNFKALDTLDLSANQLTGTVPSTLKKLTKIFNLNLGHNKLVGPFPELFVKGIESLDLSYNNFNLGQIPKWVVTSPIIYSLKLAGCGLKFKLDTFKPTETYFYDFIDLSDNQISGSPIQLLNQTTLLKEFSASGNQLQFNISQLVIPGTLKYLNLSRNQVYGKVPVSIAGLEKLDLSHNHMCGQIPKTKFSAKAFEGNDCLCGSPLPACKK